MQISELEQEAGVPAKTIRYYESIDLLPAPDRQPNGYRVYERADVARLRLVAGARRLDFSLAEIREILDLRDRGEAPCLTLLRAAEFKHLAAHNPFEPGLQIEAQTDWGQLIAQKDRLVRRMRRERYEQVLATWTAPPRWTCSSSRTR